MRDIASHSSAAHLVQVARHLLRARGDVVQASVEADSNPTCFAETRSILKAAIGAGSMSDPDWAEALGPYASASTAFLDSLRDVSIFDAMRSRGMRRVPMKSRVAFATNAIAGGVIGEGEPVPVTRVEISGLGLEPVKSAALIVVTAEVVEQDRGGGNSLLGGELRAGVAVATDANFLPGISTGAAARVSVGDTPPDVLADVRWLLDTVQAKAGSQLYLVTDAATARALATMPSADGTPAFPGVTPAGGELAGLPLLVTGATPDGVTGRFLSLIDTSTVVADTGPVTLAVGAQTSIQMDSDPAAGAASMVSMFQTNSRALLATRYLAFEVIRSGGVATVTGVDY